VIAMPAISDADAALLGLLSEEPKHPWQIEKDVRWRDMRFWTSLSQSTIYKQLRALEAAGLVSSREETADGRLRKVYTLTEDGGGALRERLCDLLTEPEHAKWRVDLGTYNIDLLPLEQALDCLGAYRAKLEESVKGYHDLEKFLVDSGCPTHRLAVARRPVHLLEGEIRWLDSYVAELRATAAEAPSNA
jgi:DNA-binding PadR family transcriptional regulator